MSTVNLIFAGDFFSGNYGDMNTVPLFRQGKFNFVFDKVADVFCKADYSFVNLEGPITTTKKKVKKTGPNLKNQIEVLSALLYLGVNGVTLANNHIMDYGFRGLQDTCNYLSSCEIKWLGAGTEKNKRSPLRIQHNDICISIHNFAENEWITLPDGSGANPIDPVNNFYELNESRSKSDYVIVLLHTGCEFNPIPSPSQVKLCRFYADLGADIVICHHSHVVSGFEYYKGKYIHYGIGNFLVDVKDWIYKSELRMGAVVHIEFSKKSFNVVQQLVHLTEQSQIEFCDYDKLTQQESINRMLCSEDDLKLAFDEYVSKVYKQYESYTEAYPALLKKFFKKGLIPSLQGENQRALMLNLIRTESHREILIKMYEKTLQY